MIAGLSALVAACAVEAPPSYDSSESEVRLGEAPIEFSPCELGPGAPSAPGTTVTCANVDLPLEYSKPEGRHIRLFVKRVQGSAPGPHKQLWLLAGGPGGAGDSFDYQAATLLTANPELDLYIPDHRGVGRSTFLGCPEHEATGPFTACIDEMVQTWGRDGLAAFSTTAAARDVGTVIERTRAPGQEVHVYGVSYGTYLAQRYLQIFPKQPTSVTLDGVCQSGLCSLLYYSYWSDQTAQEFMGECAADAFCRSKLGPEPMERVKEAIAIGEAGTCAGLSDLRGAGLKNLLHAFSRSFGLRTLVPAVTYRVLRCNEQDVVALQNLASLFTVSAAPSGRSAPPNLTSTMLMYNIAFSEMMEVPAITREELQELMRVSVFTSYNRAMHDVFELWWPRYEHDELVGGYPDTDVPVLLLNGTLDSATPIHFAEQIAPHYTRPHQRLVTIPRATHGTFFGSPTTDGKSCGLDLFRQFIAAPTKALDTSCTERVVPHDFPGNPAIAQRFFGTADVWENPMPVTRKPASQNTRDSELDDELRRANDAHY